MWTNYKKNFKSKRFHNTEMCGKSFINDYVLIYVFDLITSAPVILLTHLMLPLSIFPHLASLLPSPSFRQTHNNGHSLSLSSALLFTPSSAVSQGQRFFIFSRPITKQLVLPDIERHSERERPSPGPLQHLNWEHGCHSPDTLTNLITSLLPWPQQPRWYKQPSRACYVPNKQLLYRGVGCGGG